MQNFLKTVQKWAVWVGGAILTLGSIFLWFFNRKLRAKAVLAENEKENAVLKEKQEHIEKDINNLENELKDLRDEKPKKDDDKDIDRLSDFFNRK